MLLGELGCGEESGDALPRENKAALVRLLNDERIRRLCENSCLGLAPDGRLPRFFEREFYVALATGGVHDLRADNVALIRFAEYIGGVEIFAAVDEPRAEWMEVDVHATAIHRDDHSFNEVAGGWRHRDGVKHGGHRMALGEMDCWWRNGNFLLFRHIYKAVRIFAKGTVSLRNTGLTPS